MRRAVLLIPIALLLAGCGGGTTVSPTASTVIGTVAQSTTTQAAVKGDPTAGGSLFKAQGCGGCHTFKPAGTNGNVGPDLDKLPQYTKQANQGALPDFVHESIANPSAYIQPGYSNQMPDYGQTLSDKQIADLVAYLTKNTG